MKSSPNVVVGEVDNKSKLVAFLKRPIFGIGIIIIIVALLLVFGTGDKPKPALEIGDTKISTEQYNILIKQAQQKKIFQERATDKIVDIEKKKIAARQLNFALNEDEIRSLAAAAYSIYETDKLNDWEVLNGWDQAIDNMVFQTEKGGYSGAILYFPFSRYFAQSIQPVKGHKFDEKFGDRAAIAEDKTYALDQAKLYRTKLSAPNFNLAEAISSIHKDERLEYGFAANDSKTFFFDNRGTSYQQGDNVTEQYNKQVVNIAKTLNQKEASPIRQQKIYISDSPLKEYDQRTVPVAFYIVWLDKKIPAMKDIKKQFDDITSKIKVIKNV